MSARLAFPTDDPSALDARRRTLLDCAGTSAALAESLTSARRTALDGWTGLASDAAGQSLSTSVQGADDAADRLRRSAAAVEDYRDVIISARSQIAVLRTEAAEVRKASAAVSTASRAFVATPGPSTVSAYLIALATRAALAQTAQGIDDRYRNVMDEVASAAARCRDTLWGLGAGIASRAEYEAERRTTRTPAGVRRPGDSSDTTAQPYEGSGLGPMVPGTSVATPPFPGWPPADAGSGEYDSEFPWPDDYVTRDAAAAAALALSTKWPHAAENLSHYLANSGAEREQDVDQMLADLPGLRARENENLAHLGTEAIARARASGATSPVSFPISTPWNGYYAWPDENEDWFYATGGLQFSQQGHVTVYPPPEPGLPWTYETVSSLSTYDRYNWDGTKSTQIGPLTITDSQLAGLHRSGLAREFDMYGTSATRTTSGSS